MQADYVASAQQLIELYLLDRQIIDPKHMTFETEQPAAKGVTQAGNLQSNGTAPNNPQSFAEQFVADQPAVVSAGADGGVRRDDPPQHGDHQANGQLAYGMDSITCRATKNDTASLACFLIYVIEAGKCHTDQLEIGTSFDNRPGKGAVAQQQDVSVPNILEQLGIGHASCVADEKAMAALFKEFLEPRSDRCF